MKTYFLDSNIFLRIFTDDNKKMASDCVKLLKGITTNNSIKAYTSNIVLSEIVWTLGSFYKYPKSELVKVIKSIVNLANVEIVDNFDTLVASEIYENKSVKFIDSLISSIKGIYTRNWIVVSYDKDFDKLGAKRLEPSQLI